MDDYILESEPLYEDGNIPPTLKNLEAFAKQEGLLFGIIVYQTEKDYLENEGYCTVYSEYTNTSEKPGEHTFYIPDSRIDLGNDDLNNDDIYYWLAIKKARLAEDLDPIFAVNHFSINLPNELYDTYEETLETLEIIKNIWALDMLYEENNEVWQKYIAQLEPKVARFIRSVQFNPTKPRWGELFEICMLRAAALRSDDADEILGNVATAISSIKRSTTRQNLQAYTNFFAQLPRLDTDSVFDNVKALEATGNQFLQMIGADCSIKIRREFWVKGPEDENQPSKYLIDIILNP